MVAPSIPKLCEIVTIEDLQMDLTTGVCTVTPEMLARYLPPAEEQQELTIERAGKSLLMRY